MTNLPNKHQDDGAPERPIATKGGSPIVGSRRRLLSGAAGGMGVLMAVQAKTALGGMVCQSPSAAMSGNTSPGHGQPAPCSGGRSPGFWKQPQKFAYWVHWVPPTFKSYVTLLDCSVSGVSALSVDDIKTPGALVWEVLPGASVPAGTSPSIWAILAFPTQYGANGQLMRHLIAASLNAYYFADYALKPGQIAEIWTQLTTQGFYCPTGTTCAPGTGWSAAQVISYISGMYDINSLIDNELCKKTP